MMYQLSSSKEIIARIDNNFNIDYADWISRAPLWIADALDQLQMVTAYEHKKIDLTVTDYIVGLPDDAPQDIRRILAMTYEGNRVTRLNGINPIEDPIETVVNGGQTYTIKNGYIVTSIEEGIVTLYYQTPAIEYDVDTMIYFPRVPANSIIQGAIEWYIIYSILKRGHKHPVYSLESRNPITNPYSMWIQESKKARNQGSPIDPEDRMAMSKLLRTFLVDLDMPVTDYEKDNSLGTYTNSITGQTGII